MKQEFFLKAATRREMLRAASFFAGGNAGRTNARYSAGRSASCGSREAPEAVGRFRRSGRAGETANGRRAAANHEIARRHSDAVGPGREHGGS